MCAASNLFFIFQLQNKEMLWEWKGFKKVSVKQEKQALCGDLFYFVRWLSSFTWSGVVRAAQFYLKCPSPKYKSEAALFSLYSPYSSFVLVLHIIWEAQFQLAFALIPASYILM